MKTKKLTSNIKDLSKSLGFQLVGVSNAKTAMKEPSVNLQQWLDLGYNASMNWIKTRKEDRKNIFKYFPEVKSVISFGYSYYSSHNEANSKDKNYKISKYAQGEDYHIIVKEKLYEVLSYIKSKKENINYRVCVDTSPILEKAWAQNSGLGWIGKNTNLINNQIGSWFFLGEILLDIDLEYDNEFPNDLCGTCVKCLDACPTDALTPYILDSNKCISYLTIEHKGEFNNNYTSDLSGWIYGCDICQDVCPWNIKFATETQEKRFLGKDIIKDMQKTDWEKLCEKDYKEIVKKSAMKRAKFDSISRNIEMNKKNN